MNLNRLVVDCKQPDTFIHQVQNRWPETQALNLGEGSGDVFCQLDDKVIVIEVKEVPGDFVSSIQDGRIFRQCESIGQLTPYAFLLLSGDLHYSRDNKLMVVRRGIGYTESGWTRDSIEGVLTRVQHDNVKVRVAYNGYIDAIEKIMLWVDRDGGPTASVDRPKIEKLPEWQQNIVNFLTYFDGVGPSMAKSFADWCGDIPLWEVFKLATTEFIGKDHPKGWSNTRIEKNRKVVGLRAGEYLGLQRRKEWIEELDLERHD